MSAEAIERMRKTSPEYLKGVPGSGNVTPDAEPKYAPTFEVRFFPESGWSCRVELFDWSGHGYAQHPTVNMDWKSGTPGPWIKFEFCDGPEHALRLAIAWANDAIATMKRGERLSTMNVAISHPNTPEQYVSTPNKQGFYMDEWVQPWEHRYHL